MPLKNWSVTAGSNTSAAPNGAPEGMTIASVNDTMRQIMADVRTLAAPDTIAAAATTDIGSKDATFLTLTGTAVTITALGTVSAGIYKVIIYNAAHTVTQNATSLILLSGANRTVVAGNASLMLSEGSGNWRELFYGSAPTAASLPLAGGDLVGGVNEAITTVASATTPTIFTTTIGNVINYTGTATCTGFVAAPQAGARRTLVCAGAAVFTAGANMLIDGVASASNFTAAAGDKVHVIAVTTTQFRLTPGKADGTAVVGATTYASAAENAAGSIENKAVDPLGIREAFNATGTAPVYACRAWVNFDGTTATPCTIRGSGNVTSVTKVSTGIYTINFTTAIQDTNYGTQGTASGDTNPYIRTVNVNGTHAASCLVGSVTVRVSETSTTSVQDAGSVTVWVIR